jgi:hypothetical protein
MSYRRITTVDIPDVDDAGSEMDRFVRAANIAHFEKLIADSERGPCRDEERHRILVSLLAKKMAKTVPSLLSAFLTVAAVVA